MMRAVEFDDGFAVAKLHAPSVTFGQTPQACGVRAHYGVTVVGVTRSNQDFRHATPETVIQAGDPLIASGPTRPVEKFAGQPATRSRTDTASSKDA